MERIRLTKSIKVDYNVCCGCTICALTCSFVKEREFNVNKARIHVESWPKKGLSIPKICLQCENPKCVTVCPVNALNKNPKTGIVELDKELCINCRLCVSACPYGAIRTHPDIPYVLKCDQCGGSPECVKLCPTKALQYIDKEDAK